MTESPSEFLSAELDVWWFRQQGNRGASQNSVHFVFDQYKTRRSLLRLTPLRFGQQRIRSGHRPSLGAADSLYLYISELSFQRLARNLDGLNRDLANVTEVGSPTAQKSLGYAREVFGIDTALAPHIAEFQHHILAFAGVIDAALLAWILDRCADASSRVST